MQSPKNYESTMRGLVQRRNAKAKNNSECSNERELNERN